MISGIVGFMAGAFCAVLLMSLMFVSGQADRPKPARKVLPRKDAFSWAKKVIAANMAVAKIQKQFEREVANTIVEAFDWGVCVGADLTDGTTKAYRRETDMAILALEKEKQAKSKARDVWLDEREKLVRVWRAAKRVLMVTSIKGDPEKELKEALKAMDHVGEKINEVPEVPKTSDGSGS